MLTKINLPSSYTYEGCTSLKEIIIPSVKSISNYTFQNCTSLINIKIPSSKNEIGYYAFRGCKLLKKIIFPPSVSYLGSEIFSKMSWSTYKRHKYNLDSCKNEYIND